MKNFLLKFSALAFVLIYPPLCAVAATDYDFSAANDGVTIYYKTTSDTEPYTVSVTYGGRSASAGTSSYTGNITIPSTVEYNSTTYSVTGIAASAFRKCTLTSVTIPSSVTSIGTNAFMNCTSLSSVTFSETSSVASIGTSAFSGCTSLTSVTIPSSVTEIGASAFNGCTSLTGVTIGSGVTSIGANAFNGCTSLSSVTFSETSSVASIGDLAFQDCSLLTSITLPASLTSMGDYPFFGSGITALSDITIAAGNSTISKDETNQFLCASTKLIAYFGSSSSVDLSNFTEIGGYAFYGNTSLTSVTLSSTLTSIGDDAFYGTGLTSITIPNSVESIGTSAFYDCTSLTGVTIPNSVTSIGSYAFSNCSNLKSVTIEDGTTNLEFGTSVFGSPATATAASTLAPLESVYLGRNFTCTITNNSDSQPFSNQAYLTSLTISNNVTTLPYYSFYNCDGLTSVTIPNSVTTLGLWSFYDCDGLTSIDIPSSVTTIQGRVFQGCDALATITVHTASPPTCSISPVTSSSDQFANRAVPFSSAAENATLRVPFSWNDQDTSLSSGTNWKSDSNLDGDYYGWYYFINNLTSTTSTTTPTHTVQRYCDITDVKYSTLCSSSNVEIPEGVTAYVGKKENTSTVTCVTIDDGIINADLGVVLYAPDITETTTFYFTETTSTSTSGTESILTGTLTGATVDANSIYVLNKVGDTVGFYKYTGTSIGGNKAYLVPDTEEDTAKSYSVIFNDGDDDTTGIEAVSTATTTGNSAIYNLQGQRISTPVRGSIYIQNGEKFIAK